MGMLDFLDISLLQVRLSKGGLLLLDRDILSLLLLDRDILILGLSLLLLISGTTWKILGLVPPSLILLGVTKWWRDVLEV